MSHRRKKPQREFPLGAVLGGAGLVLVIVLFFSCRSNPEERLYQAAVNLMDCADKGDANCVLRYTGRQEREVLALSRDSVEQFLNEVYAPHMNSWSASGNVISEGTERAGKFLMYRWYKNESGRKWQLLITTVESEEGPTVQGAILTLLEAVVTAQLKPGEIDYGPRRMAREAAILKQMAPTLEGLQIKGVMRLRQVDNATDLELIPWSKWIELAAARAGG